MRTGMIAALVLATAVAAPAQLTRRTSNTTASFRGLDAVDAKVVWASGTNGRFARSLDGGATWGVGTVPGAEDLDFRDVEAFGAKTAYLMAAGEGSKSRIYKTRDGGRSWALQYTLPGPQGFFDAMAFWDADHGLVMSDPVDGRFLVLTTSDGGATWAPAPAGGMPPALAGEGGFAASGTCLVALGRGQAWFATGGGATARVFRTSDRGRSWAVAETPVAAGRASAGIFSLAFADARHGVAVGGDYQEPGAAGANVAVTRDGGATWTLPAGPRPPGYRSCAAFVPGWAGTLVYAAGTSGVDVSRDGGATWSPVDGGTFNSIAFARGGAGWAVGPSGAIASLRTGSR